LIVSLPEELAKIKSDPFPVRLSVCGLFAALSLTVKVPLRVPDAVGVKVTWIAQLEPASMGAEQLLVWAKSPVT
jgi:hypothetical protein